ncbi:MAG: lysophospholipid acyltransferase family protein [Endozoicomonas sp.]
MINNNMRKDWQDTAVKRLVQLLALIPGSFYGILARVSSRALERNKGKVARAAIKLALPGTSSEEVDRIAATSARQSLEYMLSLPRLKHIRYVLHDLDVVREAMTEDRGAIIISLHMGPPDLGTLALAQNGIAARTLIGAGKQKPWLNSLGRHALSQAGIDFIQRGKPTAVVESLKAKNAVLLYSDMRSREVPVTFFGQETSAPASGVYAAIVMKAPLIFHYCTFEDGCWQLHFERFEPEQAGKPKERAVHSCQQLIHRMEAVIREHPQLWIWHYDRFKLKKKIQ